MWTGEVFVPEIACTGDYDLLKDRDKDGWHTPVCLHRDLCWITFAYQVRKGAGGNGDVCGRYECTITCARGHLNSCLPRAYATGVCCPGAATW